MKTAQKRIFGSLVIAALLGALAWLDGSDLQERGFIMIGRERQILEGIPALSFIFVTAAGSVGCVLFALREAFLISRHARGARHDTEPPPDERA